MQAKVMPFLIVDVNFGLAPQAFLFFRLGFSVLYRHYLNFAVDHVVSGTFGHALREFTMMIRKQVPGGAILPERVDLNPNPIERAIVRPVRRPKDKTVGFLFPVIWRSDSLRLVILALIVLRG